MSAKTISNDYQSAARFGWTPKDFGGATPRAVAVMARANDHLSFLQRAGWRRLFSAPKILLLMAEKTNENDVMVLMKIKNLQDRAVVEFLHPDSCGQALHDLETVFELAAFHSNVDMDMKGREALHLYYQFIKIVRKIAECSRAN